VIVDPPLLPGATNATEIDAPPRVTVGAAGIPGTSAGTVGSETTDASLSPTLFVARTVQVYVLELVSPVITIGDVAPESDPGTPPSLDSQFAL
jgi:hypothetical protein